MAAKSKTTAKKKPANKAAPKATAATGKSAAMKTAAAKTQRTPKAPKKALKSPFGDKFLAIQKEALIAERVRYTRHADGLQAEAEQLARDREPGDVQFDDESGEGDSIAVERERDLAMSAQAREAVRDIDAALARIVAGTYGISIVSGLRIPKERLEAIPQADMRVDEKSRGMNWR